MTKYLFVCRGNLHRSPWAEKWFGNYCANNGIEAEVRSAGLEASLLDGVQLTSELASWADRICVMESYMADELKRAYGVSEQKIVCLNVPDFFSPEVDDSRFASITNEEALDWVRSARMNFGPVVFAKVLEAKVKEILGSG